MAKDEVFKLLDDTIRTMTNRQYEDPPILHVKEKGSGRPKGFYKRNEVTANITVTLTLKDKNWLKATAQKKGISMGDYIAYMIRKERAEGENN